MILVLDPVEPDHGLVRFVRAQDQGDPTPFVTALRELQCGRKKEHWIWYVLPQLRGLGHSRHAHLYGIDGLTEAHSYLQHPILRCRYRECLAELVGHLSRGSSLGEILGAADAIKAISSITLFHQAEEAAALQDLNQDTELLLLMQQFFGFMDRHEGVPPCQKTLHALK